MELAKQVLKKGLQFENHQDKEVYVQHVFSHIAKHYDLMNTILSFHQDAYWRRFAVSKLQLDTGHRLLDVACGTGMLTIEALRQHPDISIEALDFSPEMLRRGRDRLAELNLLDKVNLVEGDAMDLPYEDNSFDAAMSAFALRNVPSIEVTLQEMMRVVKPGGYVVTLELAKPTMIGFKQLYYLYFEKILPVLGKLSKDKSSYAWLPESLRRYPHQAKVLDIFKAVGFEDATYFELTGGIVAVHVGRVPK
ncbi:class I SAM-dependent methyltransferase [uncultured Veillonella sp.]|uniref:class I SAM-dependent methyltransferase n=1 Tax=uncultured Veillonella sp. TaxID=159268 RepID=UPI002620C92D|nr:class I SAM-dependent methyltransferase [uncultured Veillonella sp.]